MIVFKDSAGYKHRYFYQGGVLMFKSDAHNFPAPSVIYKTLTEVRDSPTYHNEILSDSEEP